MQKILTVFQQKNNSLFVIFTFMILMKRIYDVVNFEQPSPDIQLSWAIFPVFELKVD